MAKLAYSESEVESVIRNYEQLCESGYYCTYAKVCRLAIFEGAKVMIDYYKREINSLPVVKEGSYTRRGKKLNGVTPLQKKGLLEGIGIAKMEGRTGIHHTRIGWSGMNNVHYKNHKQGEKNSVIARVICSGTTRRVKNDFAGRARRAAIPVCEKAMAEVVSNYDWFGGK